MWFDRLTVTSTVWYWNDRKIYYRNWLFMFPALIILWIT